MDQTEQQAGEQCPPAARHILLTGGIPARGAGVGGEWVALSLQVFI